MRIKGKLTPERLREVLMYNPESGVFVWNDVPSVRRRFRGKIAGKMKDGYVRIGVDYQQYQASALAWFWVHGEWPKRNLWFRDGNRANAAIANLQFGEVDSADQHATKKYRDKYWREHPEKVQAKRLKWNYGISMEQYQEMLLAQKGVCAICAQPETTMQNGRIVPLSVDHDHIDNGLRSLLCRHCNGMLGLAHDDPSRLRAAADYLEAHAAKPKTNVIPLSGRRISGTKGN